MTNQKKNNSGKPKGAKNKGDRIAKVLARAGVASRRGVEALIKEGRISLHGKVLETPATLVTSTVGITLNGKPIKPKLPTKLWLYHKPRGLVTTHKDEAKRPTVFSALPDKLGRVISVGRLDINTEGLLILTNDGEISRWMELPKTAWKRKYRVRVHGRVNENRLKSISRGVTIDGISYGPIEARLEKLQGTNAWISIVIKEGKNREIRKVMEHMGLKVARLIRIGYGPYELGNMKEGDVAEVSRASMEEYFPRELIGELSKVEKKAKPWEKGGKKPQKDGKFTRGPQGKSFGKPTGKPSGKPKPGQRRK